MSRLTRKTGTSQDEPLEVRLGRARDLAGWTRETLAARLKVSPATVAAMEHGRWREFPNATVAVGVLRNYAQAVGLDPNPLAAELRSLLEQQRGGKGSSPPLRTSLRPAAQMRVSTTSTAHAPPLAALGALGAGSAVMRFAVQRTVWGIEGRGNWRRGAFAGRRASAAPVPRQAHRIFSLGLVLVLLTVFADFASRPDDSFAVSRLLPEAPPPPEVSETQGIRTAFVQDNFLPYRAPSFAAGSDTGATASGTSAQPGISSATENQAGRFHLVALEDGVVRLVTRSHGTLHVGTLHRGARLLLNEADIPRLDTDNPAAFVLEFADDEPLYLGVALGVQDSPDAKPTHSPSDRVWRGVPLLRSSLRTGLRP